MASRRKSCRKEEVFVPQSVAAAVLEHMEGAVVATDAQDRVICWNRAAEAFYGVGAAEVLGRPLDEAYTCRWPGDDRAPAGSQVTRPGPHVHVRRDGREVLVESTVVAMKAEDGSFAGTLAVTRDVGERVRTKQALRESEGLTRSVIDTDPNCIFARDDAGRYLLVNRAMAELHGLSPADMVGRTDGELSLLSPHDEEEARRFLADDRQVIETQQPRFIPESPLTRRDGTVRWLQTVKVPLAVRGNPRCVLGVAVDVSERRRVEDALRASEAKHRLLLEGLNEGIWALDKDGYTTFVNSRMPEMLGYTAEEMAGRHLFTFMDEESRATAQRQLAERARGMRDDHDFEFLRKDGSRLYARLAASPLTDEKGDYAGSIAGVIDITRRRRMEQALRRTRDLLERRVVRRTAELQRANEALRAEVAERHQAEAEVRGARDLLEQVFASLNLLIAYMDTDFNFVRVNDAYARADGHDPAFFKGKNHFGLYPHAGNEAIFREVVRTGRPHSTYAKPFTYPEHPERGATYWNWTLQPVADAAGRVTGIVLCLMDVTEEETAKRKLHSYQRRLRSLAAQLSLAEERERRSLAADLHDGIGQSLAVAAMKLGALRQQLSGRDAVAVGQVRQIVEQAMRDARSLMSDLSPPVLYELGLEAALEWLAEQASTRQGVPTEFCDDRRPKPLHEDVRVLLFRATRELLVNVAKHASARQARLSVSRDDGWIRVEVWDDGVGFDVQQVTARDGQGGFGLFSIRERIEHVGGRLEVDSRPGDGSRLVLLAPLVNTNED